MTTLQQDQCRVCGKPLTNGFTCCGTECLTVERAEALPARIESQHAAAQVLITPIMEGPERGDYRVENS